MQAFGAIFVLAVLVEAVMEYLGTPIPSKIKPYVAAVAAIAVCLAYGADLPAALGLPAVAYVGPVVTGLVIGRGSNYLAVIVKRLQIVAVPAQDVANVPTVSDRKDGV
jgi:hypothetical protein